MPEDEFRLMTANLFTRWVDPEDLDRVIDRHRPDVLIAQELGPVAAEVIASRYPNRLLSPDPGYAGWGIASHLPAVIASERPGWGRGGHGRIEVGGVTVHLATVHILDPMHRPLRRTAARRGEQVRALLDWGDSLPDGEPQVVAGDFNATPIWPVYRRLTARWDDLILDAARAAGKRPARTWGLPLGPKILRIDHVLGSGLAATHVAVDRVAGSDHAAVVVDLAVRP